MDAARAEHRLVSRLFYPEPRSAIFDLGNGVNAHIELGDPGYQLSSGEIIRL